MKKLILFFAVVVASVLTGCDPDFYYYFDIHNGTKSELIIELEGQEPITIDVEEKLTIYTYSRLGGAGRLSSDEDKILDMEISINNEKIPNSIWLQSFWEYKFNGKHTATYTLTITEAFLESLLSEQ